MIYVRSLETSTKPHTVIFENTNLIPINVLKTVIPPIKYRDYYIEGKLETSRPFTRVSVVCVIFTENKERQSMSRNLLSQD